MKPRYFLLNDKKKYNDLYRSGFLAFFKKNNLSVSSRGFFDSNFSVFELIMRVILFSKFSISSNLRANVIFLFLFWKKGLVIINGLGRYKYSSTFRLFLVFLFSINSKKTLVFQNFLDFRYFRKHFKLNNIIWIPGSGGVKRKIGTTSNVVLISRDDKLNSTALSIKSFLQKRKNVVLDIVGCKNELLTNKIFTDYKINCLGYVAQDNLFLSGKFFLQPSGYGEGVPHSLLDALISGMNVFIERNLFIEFGLHVIGFEYKHHSSGWVEVINNESATKKISSNLIIKQYLNETPFLITAIGTR